MRLQQLLKIMFMSNSTHMGHTSSMLVREASNCGFYLTEFKGIVRPKMKMSAVTHPQRVSFFC